MFLQEPISPSVRENPLMLRMEKRWNGFPVRDPLSVEVLKEQEMSGKIAMFAEPQDVPPNSLFL